MKRKILKMSKKSLDQFPNLRTSPSESLGVSPNHNKYTSVKRNSSAQISTGAKKP